MNADWLKSTPETASQKTRRYAFIAVIIFIFGYGLFSIVKDIAHASRTGFLPCNQQGRALAWKTYNARKLHENVAFQNRQTLQYMAATLGGELAVPFEEEKEHEEAVFNIITAHRQLVYDLDACGCDFVDGPPE